jgi:dihydrofolate synthase/folylpolyglutamate synthase
VSDRDYLFSLEQFGIKLGLEQIGALVERLGRPDASFASIVIAGTNGKGSVSAMVERGLRAAGYRTGRYISPHLIRLEERFAIDGDDVDAAALDAAATRLRAAAAALPFPPSFFEATTAIALDLFREAGVDVAVLEVGLGGRLDATNIVHSIAEAITAIDFDHEAYLGHTLDAIAREKAGVIEPGSVVVVGANPEPVWHIMRDAAATAGASALYAPEGVTMEAAVVGGRTRLRLRTPREDYGELTLALRGRHQADNALTAVRLLEELSSRTPRAIPAAAIRTALTDVAWPGRLEMFRWRGADILLDGAHNPAGARALASYLDETYGRRLPIVVGAMRDKDLAGLVAALAPVASHLVCTSASTARAASPAELAGAARAVAPDVTVFEDLSPMDALVRARALGDPVVVAGSLYLVGEVRAALA